MILLWRGVNAFWPAICLPPVEAPPGSGSGEPDSRAQPLEGGAIRQPRIAGAHVPGELDRTIAGAQQPAHLEADRFPQSPYLAIAPFVQHHAEAAVGTLARRVCADAIEPRPPILERDPRQESFDGIRRRMPPQPSLEGCISR